MRTPTLSLCAVLAVVLAQSGTAHEVKYRTFMNGGNENPPTPSLGTGTSLVTVDLDTLMMRVEASFSGLTGNTTIAHIHCCAAPPENVGVATPTPTFPGFPAGVTEGTYDNTFDLSDSSSYNGSFITSNGDLDGALNALLDGLANGEAYLNIHTEFRSGGEIRGFFQLAPEPSSISLLLFGVLGALARRRIR